MSDLKQTGAEIDMTSAFLEVVERAAVACAKTMGQGDRHRSDQVAVESMRATLDRVPIDGRVVIGEGEPAFHEILVHTKMLCLPDNNLGLLKEYILYHLYDKDYQLYSRV